MATGFVLQTNEVLVQRGRVSWRDGMTMRQGTGFLTNQRYVQYSRSPWIYALGGIIGSLIASLLIKDRLDFEFPVAQLSNISRDKQLLNNNIVVLKLQDGKEYRLFARWDTWFAAFQKALGDAQMTLSPSGDNSWAVLH